MPLGMFIQVEMFISPGILITYDMNIPSHMDISSDMHISVLDIDSMGIRNGYSRIDEQRLMHWLQYSKNHDSNRAPTLVTQRKGNDFLDLLNTTRQNEHQRDCSNYVAFGVDALPQHVHDNNCTGCAWGDVFSTSIA